MEKILKIIEKEGYIPKKYGYITGQLLKRYDGQMRFIIWNGHRRILSLANLGYKKLKVEVSGGDRWDGVIRDHLIDLRDIDDWSNVKNGLYTKKEAEDFFYTFFESK